MLKGDFPDPMVEGIRQKHMPVPVDDNAERIAHTGF
jgi:hypothetical protein